MSGRRVVAVVLPELLCALLILRWGTLFIFAMGPQPHLNPIAVPQREGVRHVG